MKKLMMMTTAVGLCLAAPAFAQTTTDPNAPPAATNAPADPQAPAPARSNQPANAQAPAASSNQPTNAQAPASNRPANAQAPSGSSAPASAQAPSGSNAPASAQAPAPSNAPTNAQAPAGSNAPSRAQTPPASNQPANAQAPANQPTNAQAPANQPTNAQAPAASKQNQPAAAQSQPAQRDKPAASSAQNAPGAGTSANRSQTAAAALPQQTQVRISQTLLRERIRPANVNFAVSVGIAVPSSVTLRPLPASVIQIAPQFRGHRFFVTQDRIVIVEPARKTVIAVLDANSGARVAAPAASKASVSFTEQQRSIIRNQAASSRASTTGSSSGSRSRISIQEQVPETVELLEFSEEVVREIPTVRSYRYIQQDNELLLVDPGERRVIEIIR
jgi:hypothetical protein